MPDKPKVAFYWCASCGGCEESVVDLAENILDVVAAVDIVMWPVAMDFKKKDVEAMADGSILVSYGQWSNTYIRTRRDGKIDAEEKQAYYRLWFMRAYGRYSGTCQSIST